jgi:hypothetical protein
VRLRNKLTPRRQLMALMVAIGAATTMWAGALPAGAAPAPPAALTGGHEGKTASFTVHLRSDISSRLAGNTVTCTVFVSVPTPFIIASGTGVVIQANAAAACLDDVTGQPVLLTTRIDLAESLSTNGTTANQGSTAAFAPQAIAQTFTRTSCSVGINYQNVAGAIFHFDPNRVAGGPTITLQESSQTVTPQPGQCTPPTPPGQGGGPPGGCAVVHTPAAITPKVHTC